MAPLLSPAALMIVSLVTITLTKTAGFNLPFRRAVNILPRSISFSAPSLRSTPIQTDPAILSLIPSDPTLLNDPTLAPLISASVTALFKDVDTDQSGYIDVDELTVLLRKLEIDASDAEIVALFRSLDTDDNGTIDYDEFSRWYANTHSSITATSTSVQSFLSTYPKTLTFDPTLPVPPTTIQQAVSASRNVDLGGGQVGWRNIVVTSEGGVMGGLEALNEEATADEWRPWEKAPYLLVVVEKEGDEGGSGSDLRIGQSIQNFCLSLQAEGISTRVKESFMPLLPPRDVIESDTAKKARELLSVGEQERVKAVVMFGFAKVEIKKRRGVGVKGVGAGHTTVV